MRLLVAEIEIDGNLSKGVVVDVSEDGRLLSTVSLSELPCEPANTVYYGGRLVVKDGVVILPTLYRGEFILCEIPPV